MQAATAQWGASCWLGAAALTTLMSRLSFFGWTNETASIPCSWSGILCYDDGTLRITLEYTGMTGRADAVGQPKARAWGLLLSNCHSLQHT